MLPTNLAQALQRHLLKRRSQHEQDMADGFGSVHLPYSIARKYPNANREVRQGRRRGRREAAG
jgi:hypothetical protein